MYSRGGGAGGPASAGNERPVPGMIDPSTANCRVYVGNIDNKVNAEEVDNRLREKFSVYGNIVGVTIQRGFGFVQYENDQSAANAIQNEHGQMLFGRKLNVRPSMTGEGGKGFRNQVLQDTSRGGPGMGMGSGGLGDNNGPPVRGGRGGRRGGRPRGGGNNIAPNAARDRSPLDKSFREPYFGGNRQNAPQGASFSGTILPPSALSTDRNDCEIIVVSKTLTEYAEFIEAKLKSLGLSVDVLFPNEDVPIGRVLANISSRGCLYAVLVTPQNEEHRSMTLNILHGIPQEHRNMPVDDAVILIERNFDAYMRGDPMGLPGGDISGRPERHPDAIQTLLNLLAENRQLTVLQYDRIIKYLQERREIQLKRELGDAADGAVEPPLPTKEAAELQNRIMNILNSSGGNKTASNIGSGTTIGAMAGLLPSGATAGTGTSPAPSSAITPAPAAAPLLNDPSVQKALDSLLQGDILKTFVKKSSPPPISDRSTNDNYGTSYSQNIRRF